jgi:hypothetical protein
VAMVVESLFVLDSFMAVVFLGQDVVNVDVVLQRKRASTVRACPFLDGEQLPKSAPGQGVLLESHCPVREVAVIGGGVSPHFYMSLDGRPRMVCERNPVGLSFLDHEGPLVAGSHAPIPFDYPPVPLLGVSAVCPSSELGVEVVVAAREGCRCCPRPEIPGPSPDYRVEGGDERWLWRPLVFSDYRPRMCDMFLDGLFTRPDDRLESQRLSVLGFPRMVLPLRKLPDGETQEVKPRISLQPVVRVGDSGFRRA